MMPTNLKSIKTIAGVLLLPAILYVYWLGHVIHLQEDRTALIAAIWQHVGYGMVLALPVALYFFLPKGQRTDTNTLLRKLLNISYWVFVATIVFLTVSGPLIVWSRGSTLKIFSWVKIPSPVEKMPQTYEFLEHSHGIVADFFAFALIGFGVLLAASFFKKD